MAKSTARTVSNTSAKSEKSSSDLVDEQLERYRSMRDFSVTDEPSGIGKQVKTDKPAPKSKSKLPFVIQKHAASHLHYDFRLGWNGVLKSWAVAKGPSYYTKDKRLAVQVEDHPIEYGGFEGIIPKGQYGGGTVMLWDTGTWEPQAGHTDVDAGLRDGSLKFTMFGEKMKGNWTLVRMGGKAANASKPNWLLIKEHDQFERTAQDPCVTDQEPRSVVTGRSLEEIASSEDHIWNSKDTASGNAVERKPEAAQHKPRSLPKPSPAAKKKASGSSRMDADLSSYPDEALPEFIPPQLALQADRSPDRDGWVHELKLDGYRIEARKQGSEVALLTRSGLDWTHRMKEIAAQIALLPAASALLDGEVVVLSEAGTTNFADLQAAFREGANHPLTYFIFDLLHFNGHNLRGAELLQRKQLLYQLLQDSNHSAEVLRYSEHLETSGEEVFYKACELDAEGIISKRAASRYSSGRTGDWLKIKCIHEQEFVIGGFTLPSNGIHGVGALLLGYYDGSGKLIYAGRTGTGFTQKTHKLIRDQLEKIKVKTTAFTAPPAEARRGAIWVQPTLVAQVNFATWTADKLLRQAAFKGLREDKPAAEVRREEAVTLSEVNSSPKPAASKKPAKANVELAEHASVRLTHPDKILDTESKLTKQQLADYYWQIAGHMLPQITNRPLSLVRCPEGSTKPCFFQKHTSTMLPPGITSIDVPDKKTGKPEPYITLSTKEALAGLAQMGVLEVHPWGSENDDLEHPDRIIIDLDPDEAVPWRTLAEGAEQVRKLLEHLGLKSFLKSTGGKGLHLVAPVVQDHDWSVIKQFAQAIALHLEKQQPKLYLSKMTKAARKDRIYVDYLRNERGATAVAAFSPRARAGAPVSVPLDWAELKSRERPIFHVADFDQWKERLAHDPWELLPSLTQTIDPEKVSEILDF